MLVFSVKDHEQLQKVEVTDFWNQGMFILEEYMLVQLRNSTRINLDLASQSRMYGPGSYGGVDIPFGNTVTGVVMKNLCFNINHIYRQDDEDQESIPTALDFRRSPGDPLKDIPENLWEYCDSDD